MDRARLFFQRLQHPPRGMLAFLPPLSFAALIALFSARSTGSAPAYLIYGKSAYSLAIWLAALPGLTKRVRSAMMNSRILQKAAASPFAGRYRTDPAFRGRVGICPGMAANFLYAVFRAAAGVRRWNAAAIAPRRGCSFC